MMTDAVTRTLLAWTIGWIRHGLASLDRMVLIAGITVRVAGIVMAIYSVAFAWPNYPRPGLAVLLVIALCAGTAVVLWSWIADGALGRGTLAIDVPMGVVVLLAGSAISTPAAAMGWTYTYTVFVALTLGLACRTGYGAALAGSVWMLAYTAGWMWLHPDADTLGVAAYVAPSYVLNPVLGWLVARRLRRTAVATHEARTVAVAQASALATVRERNRHARALHDRVLQTLEVLVRDERLVSDADLRHRLREQADWLRVYIETGQAARPDDLASGLVAATRAARRSGLVLELNDAVLRTPGAVPDLAGERREALVEATHQLLTALATSGAVGGTAHTVVRVAPQRGGVLVTILTDGHGELPDPAQVAWARDRVGEVGGRLTVEPVPYVELWMPGTQGGRAATTAG